MQTFPEQQLRDAVAIIVICIGLLVWFNAGFFGHELLAQIAILAIFAMSLDLLAGYSGQVSLGHAAFFGTGAYGTAALTAIWGWPLSVAMPISIIITAGLAFCVAIFAVRLSGIFFLMVTLAIGEVFHSFFFRVRVFGGDDGLGGIPRLDLGAIGIDLLSPISFSMFTLITVALVYWGLSYISRSSFGAVISGIRQNESRMAALGCKVRSYKVWTFTVAACLAALAGSLSAQHDGFVSPDLLSWTASGEVLIVVIVGGMSSLVGPIIGAVVVVLLAHYVSGLTNYWMFFMGLFFVAVVLAGGQGIYGLFEKACRRLHNVKRS